MKMRILDRLILRLSGVVAVICGVLLYLVPFSVLGKMEYRFSWVRWVFYGAGILSALIGLYIILVPRRYRYSKKDYILRKTENGDMHISVKAMESQVRKCVDLHKEITMHGMRISNLHDGVYVDIKASLASNISIPLSVETLQKQVKQYLLAATGIEIRQVRIVVVGTEAEVTDTPYRVDSQQAEKTEEARPEEKKVPVHRRIFGREEEAPDVTAPASANAPVPDEKEAPEETGPEAENAMKEEPVFAENAGEDKADASAEETSAEQTEAEDERTGE